ncbi:hypothetical protein Lfu02_75150 [Longispora fulva]|uniref:Uncharacterized protein n=1 Tax=Longispora fulva TaxID=619741 RepID=A0A8J7GP71_9ACTN|nr:hypothetical protein [Longispora fulva]MBG6134251.1 hypothetical protein [Longispora fulva]GIG63143.1 hypothetical protein Lfu02_75150 [Longispora fulva]
MSLVITFTGRTPLAASGPNARYHVWTYAVQPTSPSDLLGSQRIALALPADVDVKDPRLFPDVPALAGAFLEPDANISRQYVGRAVNGLGPQTITFVAPADQTDRELFLVGRGSGRPWTVMPFAKSPTGEVNNVQLMPAPASSQRVFTGRPVAEFAGTLPYASEIFGVYQPLAGWIGRQGAQRIAEGAGLTAEQFGGVAARELEHPAFAALAEQGQLEGILSPVGLVNLFREYFFEFDTFLGAPAGHLWISPGGTVEVIETTSRRSLVEKSAEQSEQTVRRVEESLTEQTDVADAVKESNANDTTLGASASAGASFAGIYHGDASATYSAHNATGKSSEQTHKHTRTQSSKVSSEITRNFKTTFKTVTETTDTSSRRYVVQNTTQKLLNYELRRKMRKVGVQVQHLGTQLSWQVFLGAGGGGAATVPAPGRKLGLGELVHVVPAPDLTSIRKPEPLAPLKIERTTYSGVFPIRQHPSSKNAPHLDKTWIRFPDQDRMHRDDGEEDEYIRADCTFHVVPPGPDYVLRNDMIVVTAHTQGGGDANFIVHEFTVVNAAAGVFKVLVDELNSGGGGTIALTISLTWDPPAKNPGQEAFDAAMVEYHQQVALLQRKTYADAVRDRLSLLSKVRARPSEELRKEERQVVFADLVTKLRNVSDPHLGSELIRQMFDIDRMLYFVNPDFWRPDNVTTVAGKDSLGRYPVPEHSWTNLSKDPIEGETVVSWYSHTSSEYPPDAVTVPQPAPTDPPTPPVEQPREWRVDYLITEDTLPAPMGSSLGWLIQADGDERRNEFLNAAWVKVVLPIRPGHEVEAFQWLRDVHVEGEAAFDKDYAWQPGDPEDWRGKKIGYVLDKLVTELQATNSDIRNTLATERVFETGFDPLEGGFRPAEPHQIFDQWVEVLPTDQIVAVEVTYDPKTGQQL